MSPTHITIRKRIYIVASDYIFIQDLKRNAHFQRQFFLSTRVS